MGAGGIMRFDVVDTSGTLGRVKEGGVGKGRRGRAFEYLLCPRGFDCSAGSMDVSSSGRMTDSGRAGAGETCTKAGYREIKPWNWRA